MGRTAKAFLNGYVNLFTQWPAMVMVQPKPMSGLLQDALALKGDWERVGLTFNDAVIAWKNQNKERIDGSKVR